MNREKAKLLFDAGLPIRSTKDEIGRALAERINKALEVAQAFDIKLAISPREVEYDAYCEAIYCRRTSKD